MPQGNRIRQPPISLSTLERKRKRRRDVNNVAKIPTGKRRKQLITSIHSAREVVGRREFFRYRDLGLSEATGWHYHTCEAQVSLCLKGWADIVFEDGTEIRIKAGDFEYIPGGVLHNEVATSDDLEAIEISIPADMGTVPVDPPAWWLAREKQRANPG
jgi:mannose-6-phosphate isomerase-like protein (cupin superfamily)